MQVTSVPSTLKEEELLVSSRELGGAGCVEVGGAAAPQKLVSRLDLSGHRCGRIRDYEVDKPMARTLLYSSGKGETHANSLDRLIKGWDRSGQICRLCCYRHC
jgi:hypothetical protein